MRRTEPEPLITWEGVRGTVGIVLGIVFTVVAWVKGAPLLFAGCGIVLSIMAATRHVTFRPAVRRWGFVLRDLYGIAFGIAWSALSISHGAPRASAIIGGVIALAFAVSLYWSLHPALARRRYGPLEDDSPQRANRGIFRKRRTELPSTAFHRAARVKPYVRHHRRISKKVV